MGKITDQEMNTFTVDDTASPGTDIGNVSSIFGWLANMIKLITGKANWRTPPATTLEDVAGHLADTANRHKASNVSITDAAGNFTEEDVEGALTELFTSVSDGKDEIATAITDKGVPASGSDTFPILADKIGDIQTETYFVEFRLIGDSSFSTAYIQSITYEAGLFVAVGESGKLATSPDGINWTQRNSSFGTTYIESITHGAGLFVAVGGSGKLATSPDGINWTQRDSSFSTAYIQSITYGAGLFVAVGISGKLATSLDGINWIQRTSSFGTSNIESITYGAGLFVAGGSDGKLATSPDGINWIQRDSGFGTSYISSITYGAGLFIAVGIDGKLATSPDGIDWIQRDSSFITTTIYNITYGAGLFVTVGSDGKLATSPDGIKWTQRDSSFNGTSIFGITYGAGLFVAVGIDGKLARGNVFNTLLTGNAQPENVLSLKTFSNAEGVNKVGTMTNRGAYNITPGTSNVTIPVGYHNGAGVCYGDGDLVAENIKSGVNIFGVNGNLLPVTSIASDNQKSSYDNIITTTSTSFQKRLQFAIVSYGTVRMSFEIRGGAYMIDVSEFYTTTYAQIYKNGVAVGVLRSTNYYNWVGYTEDVNVSTGDLLQVYLRTTALEGIVTVNPGLRFCRLKFNQSPEIIVANY